MAVFQSLWGSILPCSRAAALAVVLPKRLMRTGACIRRLSLSVSLFTLLFSPKVAASFVSLTARWIVTELADVLQVSPVRLLCKWRGSAHRQFPCLLPEGAGVGGRPSTGWVRRADRRADRGLPEPFVAAKLSETHQSERALKNVWSVAWVMQHAALKASGGLEQCCFESSVNAEETRGTCEGNNLKYFFPKYSRKSVNDKYYSDIQSGNILYGKKTHYHQRSVFWPSNGCKVLEILFFNSITLRMSGSAPARSSSDPTVAWVYLLYFIDWA